MQRNTGDTQSMTVEYGFLDNKNDAAKLKNNYTRYADAVIRALLDYIGYEDNQDTYTVKNGDSLWSISRRLGTTVQKLKDVNNLTNNLLSIGQILIIPKDEEVISDNTYIVKSGDTLYGIANKYNISVNELKSLNNLTSNTLSIGQILQIPTDVDNIQYIVKSGDTLYGIANTYNTTVQDIKNLNNLTSNILSIGQVLNIPKNVEEKIYIVKKGDTLYSIANTYNTTVDEIKRKNNLVSNTLSIGSTLIL